MVAAVEAILESKVNGRLKGRWFGPWSSALRDSCCFLLPSGGWSPAAAGTVPMVSNLYQGMLQDPVTGLYYERSRWYSPSLGLLRTRTAAGILQRQPPNKPQG